VSGCVSVAARGYVSRNMLELPDVVLRAARFGAIVGAVVGAFAGLVLFGDRLFVPVYAMLLGGLAGAAVAAGTAMRRLRTADADADSRTEPATVAEG
jgi:hypothetical protein